MKDKYQLVWWFPKWNGIWYEKLTRAKHGELYHIYIWCLCFGFFEIRKWR